MFKKIISKIKTPEFLRFFLVGITSFGLDLLLLNIFISIFKIPEGDTTSKTLANVASSTIAIIFNYFLQRSWAFKVSNKENKTEMFRFALVQVFNLIVFQRFLFEFLLTNIPIFLPFLSGSLYLGSFKIPLAANISKVLVTFFQTFVSFFAYKFFVFKKN